MISVIVPDIANPFFAELVRGVEARAVEHDLAVFVSSTEGDVDREHRYLNVVIGQRPRGVLFTPAGDLELPLSVLGNRLPVVLIDRESTGSLCSVAVDDFRGGGLAVEHLHTLGHRALTWVVGPSFSPSMCAANGWHPNAANQRGIDVTEVRVSSMTVAEGKLAAATLRAGPLPTAVVCANDLLALGVEFGLLTADVAVPATTSIVGFDDIEFAASAAVTLTSVTRPAFATGRRRWTCCSARAMTQTIGTDRSSSSRSSASATARLRHEMSRSPRGRCSLHHRGCRRTTW